MTGSCFTTFGKPVSLTALEVEGWEVGGVNDINALNKFWGTLSGLEAPRMGIRGQSAAF